MGRPPLAPGTFGAISSGQDGKGRYVARARFRNFDGSYSMPSATGNSAGAAERALRVKLLTLASHAPMGTDITPNTFLTQVTAAWLDEITDEKRLRPQSIRQYRHIVERLINPTLGQLRVREVTVGAVDGFLRARAREHPAQAKMAKHVLSRVMNLAERHQAIRYNPVSSVRGLRSDHQEIRALEPHQVAVVRDILRAHRNPEKNTGVTFMGPKPTSDLADIVDVMLGTGLRIGEVLALRWSDVDLSSEKATISVTGTIIKVDGKLDRQSEPKSRAGRRTLVLPSFAAGVLLRRQIENPPNDFDAVFPSRAGTWMSDHNVRRRLRDALAETDYSWVSTRTFRKTVATLIDRTAGAKSAARQLGHASEATTEGHYIAKTAIAPDLSGVIEEHLAPRHRDAPQR